MAVSMALFEHASGYGLFHVKEFEEIAMLQSAVEESVTDISAFNSVVTLQSFQPFKNAEDALANINAVSEGLCSDQLKFFLQSNMPKKLKKVTLGVLDPKLGAAVSESIGVKVSFFKDYFLVNFQREMDLRMILGSTHRFISGEPPNNYQYLIFKNSVSRKKLR